MVVSFISRRREYFSIDTKNTREIKRKRIYLVLNFIVVGYKSKEYTKATSFRVNIRLIKHETIIKHKKQVFLMFYFDLTWKKRLALSLFIAK